MYDDESIKTLLQHYGKELSAESVVGNEFVVPALISSDSPTEWKTSRMDNKSTSGGYERAIEGIVHKFNAINYASKLEHPGESVSDYSSSNCYCGVAFPPNEKID